MPFANEDQDRFVMLHQTVDAEKAFAAVAAKDLTPGDLAIFLVLMHHMDRAGKVRVAVSTVASLLGYHPNSCSRALARLRKQELVAKGFDPRTGEHYFLLNPFVASVGSGQRRGHLWKQFEAALDKPLAPTDTVG